METDNSLTIIISALNEEKNVAATVYTVSSTAKKFFDRYEILLFNDGSIDKTGQIADDLAKSDTCIKVIHNQKSQCLGGVYKQGLALARMNYIMLVNGKNDNPVKTLESIFSLKDQAEIIIPYTQNSHERSVFRRSVSKLFIKILNRLSRLNLKYYNHSVLHKTDNVKKISIETNSYAFQAEILIKLIKSGHSYKEVGVTDRFEKGIKTKAFKLNNVWSTFMFLCYLIQILYIQRKY